MSLNGVISSFNTGIYTVAREGSGTYVDGILQVGAADTPFSIVASIQPASGRDLKNLPEAQHGEETRVVFTTTELRTRTPAGAPDTVMIDGEPWTVVRVERWQHWGTTHYRAYISRGLVP